MWNSKRKILKEEYYSGSTWYRIYTNGWVEQGFRCSSDNQFVTFPVAMKDVNYSVSFGMLGDSGSRVQSAWAYSPQAHGMRVGMGTYSGGTSQPTSVVIRGFKA